MNVVSIVLKDRPFSFIEQLSFTKIIPDPQQFLGLELK